MNGISDKIIALVEQARLAISKNVNSVMVVTYYHIGRMLVEEWQKGEERAEYGTQLLANVSADLTKVFKKGFSVQNLERMRSFFLIYSKSSSLLRDSDVFQKSSNGLRIFENNPCFLPIPWSHYLFLMRIKDETERQFYEVESFQNQWILKELERQFNTGLFERLAVSKNKSEVMRLAKEGQIIEQPQDLIKDPLMLDFLGLAGKSSYTETDLETAIINQIEKFMLELGKGFFFGGRQVRFSFNEEHYL